MNMSQYKRNKNTVTWEKWENYIEPKENKEEEDEDTHYEGGSLEQGLILSRDSDQPIMITPMGSIPIPEYRPDNFNLWLGHSNFDITDDIVDLVENSEGIETLEVFTRYRMRVGIGKVFNAGDVINWVNKALAGYFRIKDAGV